MHVDMPATDIDQLTWPGVRQHPRVLRYGGRLGKHDFADGKQQDDQGSTKYESGRKKPWNEVSMHVRCKTFFVARAIAGDSDCFAEFVDTPKGRRMGRVAVRSIHVVNESMGLVSVN